MMMLMMMMMKDLPSGVFGLFFLALSEFLNKGGFYTLIRHLICLKSLR